MLRGYTTESQPDRTWLRSDCCWVRMLIPWRSGSVAGYGQAMTYVQIRPVTGDDAEAVSALRRAVYSYKILSPAAARHMITVSSPAERSLALGDEVDGQLVAWGSAGLNTWTSEPG